MSLTFAAFAADHVLSHGPATLDDLHQQALAQGVTKARAPSSLRSSVTNDRRFVVRPDGRIDTAARLLIGATLTTRPRHPMRDGVLWPGRDLEPLLGLQRDGWLDLEAGGRLVPGAGGHRCWTGPDGWAAAADDAPLLALTWDGTSARVRGITDALAADSSEVQDVRRVLARHAWSDERPYYASPVPSLMTIVVRSLVEDPDLLRRPLPPLSELLPLPEELRPQDAWSGSERDTGHPVRVHLPARVVDELSRRADLLGERLPDYAALVLGAAADRLQVQARPARQYLSCRCDDEPRYDRDVVPMSDWQPG